LIELLKGGLNRDTKKRMVKPLIRCVMLYEAETWTLRKEDVKRIEDFEMWIWQPWPCLDLLPLFHLQLVLLSSHLSTSISLL